MTQADEGAFAGVESDPSTEEVVQLLNERIECVGSGDMVGRLVDEGLAGPSIRLPANRIWW